MIDFGSITSMTIPEGVVTQVAINGSTIWTLPISVSIKDIPVGSYIKYTANNYSSWRVMYNNNGQLDIVSAESVDNVTLSGNSGYCNAVQTLNNKASEYVAGFATKGRSIGCTSSSQATITVGDTQASLNYDPYTDTHYTTDFNQLVNNGLVQSSGDVWLASRVDLDRTEVLGQLYSSFGCVRTISSTGKLSQRSLQKYTKVGWTNDQSQTCGFRPVISLPSGLTVTGGKGTESNPYVLTN